MSENEFEFKFLEEQSLVGIVIYRDNKVIYANRALFEIFEYSAEEFFTWDTPMLDILVHPDDKEMVTSRFYKRLSGEPGLLQRYDFRILTKNGAVKWVTMHVQRLEFEGAITLAIFIIDITDRKKTETALIESENRFRAIIETARDFIFIKDCNRRYTHVNPAMEKLYGLSADQIIGKTFEEMSGQESGDRIRAVDERVLGGEIVEEENPDEFNSVSMTFSSIKVPLYDNNGTISGLCGISRNITERKNAEEALIESEYRYRTIFNSTAVSIWEYDFSDTIERLNRLKQENIPDYSAFFNEHPEVAREIFASVKPVDVNATTLTLYGAATKEELLASYGKDPTPEAITALINAFIAYLGGKQYYEGETVNITLDGRRIHALLGITFPYADRGHSRALVTVTDITEIKRMETALRKSEEQFKSLFRSLDDIVWSATADGSEILFINPAFERVYGRPVSDIYKNPALWLDVVHSDDRESVEKNIRRLFQTRAMKMEYRIIRPDGSIRWVLDKRNVLFNAAGKPERLVGTTTDITERKLLDDERSKASKLESIGILAGGIAHDFNNLLAAIMGNISLSLAEVDTGSRVFALLNEAEMACNRARGLTQQLLTFSKGGEPVRETVSVSVLLKESVMFSLIGSNVAVNFSIDNDLWHVDIDRSQIHQAINNIIINAVQAMPGGGTISVLADNVMIGDSDRLPLEKGAYIKISIVDEGTGIPREHRSKIFDPYFTTKHKGSGLGLTTTYSIVNRHNGYIDVESRLGAGSTFHLYLPVSSMKAAEEIPFAVSAERMTGKILIMDDEIQVRTIIADMLEYLGNETEVASDGVEAIEIYRRALDSGKRFDAVIVDLTVPGGMGGKETIGKLLEIDPEVKAIVSSGYSHDPVISDYSQFGFVDYLTKPYHLNDLKNLINRVLTKKSTEKQ